MRRKRFSRKASDVDYVMERLDRYNSKSTAVTNVFVEEQYGYDVFDWEVEFKYSRYSLIIRFTGSRRALLVCVRRVFARMAQGGTPYGSH